MLITHVKPADWVDTNEAGKIQPSAVAGMAHRVSLETEDIEMLRGPRGEAGPMGPQGPAGPAGGVVTGGGVGAISVIVVGPIVGAFEQFTTDGTAAYKFAQTLSIGSTDYVPAGQVWRSLMGSAKGASAGYILAVRVS